MTCTRGIGVHPGSVGLGAVGEYILVGKGGWFSSTVYIQLKRGVMEVVVLVKGSSCGE